MNQPLPLLHILPEKLRFHPHPSPTWSHLLLVCTYYIFHNTLENISPPSLPPSSPSSLPNSLTTPLPSCRIFATSAPRTTLLTDDNGKTSSHEGRGGRVHFTKSFYKFMGEVCKQFVVPAGASIKARSSYLGSFKRSSKGYSIPYVLVKTVDSGQFMTKYL